MICSRQNRRIGSHPSAALRQTLIPRSLFSLFAVASGGKQARMEQMNASAVKEVAERQPFRPFTVRLNNGAQYAFSGPRNFGAPKNYREIVFFGDSELVLIDLESITEIIRQ